MARNSIQRPAKKRRVRIGKLDTIAQIAGFQKKLLRLAMKSALTGEGVRVSGASVSVNDCYKIVNMTSQVVKSVEAGEIEERLSKLEERINEREKM